MSMFRGDRPVGAVGDDNDADGARAGTGREAPHTGGGTASRGPATGAASDTPVDGDGNRNEGSRWVDPDRIAAAAADEGHSRWIDPDRVGDRRGESRPRAAASTEAEGAGSRPAAADYEARIADLEATVAELRTELAVRAEERRALVDHYESLLQTDGEWTQPTGTGVGSAGGSSPGSVPDGPAEATSGQGAGPIPGAGRTTGDDSPWSRLVRRVRRLVDGD
jgi:hypothetical protein